MAKILISGSSGFIGKHLFKRLLQEGNDVTPLIHEILYNPEELKDAIHAYKPDYIYHLASYGNMSNQKEHEEIFNANVLGTWNLLNATKDIPYKAFINFGTSSEYGKQDRPMTEDMLPKADSFYACTKVASTYLARAYAKQFCKPIVTIRPFSVYGPGEAEFRFIPQVIKYLNNKRVMNVDTQANHDWIYIDDFINGVMKITDNAQKLFGEVVNIGTGKQYSNQQVINMLEKISGKKLQVNVFDNMRLNDSKIWMDGSNILHTFDWIPSYNLRRGLEKTYEYYTK